MMIRINLLPVRQVRKREAGRQVLALFAAVGLVTLGGNFYWYLDRQGEHDARQAQIAATQQQIAELEKVIGEVNNIKRREDQFNAKLKVLENLRRARAGPVRMLDALATATPKQLSLKEFEEKSNQVRITGTGKSHDDVADFMRQLAVVVWTPKGLGRLVERKQAETTARVELAVNGAIEDFPGGEVVAFFTDIELRKAEAVESREGQIVTKRVDFEINLAANYAI
jgi:type IV pilus assembly protein PilN